MLAGACGDGGASQHACQFLDPRVVIERLERRAGVTA
jgi:hypothetical protein